MNSGGYFEQLARIMMYLGQIAANETKEVAQSLKSNVEGIVHAMKVTAVFIVSVAILMLGIAMLTKNGIFIGLAGLCIAIPTLILHWTTRPVTALIELFDVPTPNGIKRRMSGLMLAWHSVVLGILYTLASVSLMYTLIPFPANPAAMVVVTLAMIGLWVVGKQVTVLGYVFQAVGYLFLIAVFLFSCYWAFFPKSAAAYRDYLNELDSRSAGEYSAYQTESTHDGPRASPNANPISILNTKMQMKMDWGFAYEREPDRIVTCHPDVTEYTATGIQVTTGDIVYFVAKGTIQVVGTNESSGPEGFWPSFMNQQRLLTCPYPQGEVVYNLLVMTRKSVGDTNPAYGVIGSSRHFQIDDPGMIHLFLNCPANSFREVKVFGFIPDKEYDRPAVSGEIRVAIWVDRYRK